MPTWAIVVLIVVALAAVDVAVVATLGARPRSSADKGPGADGRLRAAVGSTGGSQAGAPGNAAAGLGRRAARLLVSNAPLVLAVLCALVFLALLEDVLEGQALTLDRLAFDAVVVGMRSDALTPVMQSLSGLATPLSLVIVLVLVAAFAPGKRPGACAAVNLAGAFALNQLLKAIIQRPRPDGISLVVESGYSFPSGHSMVAMAFFGLLVWMVWRYDRDRVERIWACAVLILVIAGIGFSRVYLGVHYASDVIAGFCVSLAWLALYTRLVAPLMLGETVVPHDRSPRPRIPGE